MPAPSRSTIITVKNQKNFFDFLKLYNELGKVKFFQLSIIRFRGQKCSFPLGQGGLIGSSNKSPCIVWLSVKKIFDFMNVFPNKQMLYFDSVNDSGHKWILITINSCCFAQSV